MSSEVKTEAMVGGTEAIVEEYIAVYSALENLLRALEIANMDNPAALVQIGEIRTNMGISSRRVMEVEAALVEAIKASDLDRETVAEIVGLVDDSIRKLKELRNDD
jgi:hypothetical protein